MIDTKTLSIKDKISLLNKLYEELSGHGIGGDTELAHINLWEADLLRSVGGAGTVNEVTGLRQYLGGGGGSPPPQPTQTTTRQVPEYAPEQREYIEDIFGKSQELYEQRTAEGFQPFPGQQLAPFAAQEQEAFSGIESLARGPGAAPAFDIARTAALGAAAPVTAAEIQQGMNPYQQAVTDIAKREASRQYARGPQAQLRTGAVEAGGLRGARRFIEEAEGQRNLQQQMSDIQTMGSQQAYNQAMAEAAAARGRLANLATQMPSIGTGAYQQQLAQFGQLGGVGEAQRAREQAAIDLAQNQFQREQMFPEETLATYLRFITNAPSPSGFQQTTQQPTVPGPSGLQQLAGLGISGAAAGKAFNLFNRGGAVGRQAGLSGVVRRAGGGQIVRMQDGGGIFDRILSGEGLFGKRAQAMQEAFGTAPGVPTVREQGDFLYPNKGIGSGYDPSMELLAGLSEEEIKTFTKPTPIPTPAPEPKPEPETIREEVDDSLGKLRSGDVGDKPRLDDAAYLDIAAAALKGAYEPGTIGRETGFVESLGKVLSPAAAAAAAGMRESRKTQREEEALEMARSKEAREATSATVVDALRKAQTDYEIARPGIEKDKARSDLLRGVSSLYNQQIITEEQAMEFLTPILGTTSSAGGNNQSGPASQRKPGSF